VSPGWAAITITFMVCVSAMIIASMICADREAQRALVREMSKQVQPDNSHLMRGVN
jgi:uncharacterized heparinase superfamily protein